MPRTIRISIDRAYPLSVAWPDELGDPIPGDGFSRSREDGSEEQGKVVSRGWHLFKDGHVGLSVEVHMREEDVGTYEGG